MICCKSCNLQFEHTRTFKLHLDRVHQLTLKEYVIKYDFNGVHPTCACGCGEEVTWRNDAYFLTLKHGHVTQEFKEKQRKNRLNKSLSVETRKKLSQSIKAFFSSDEGKEVATSRAESLKQFYLSEEGEKWSEEQSKRMLAINSSEEGKLTRKKAGQKIKAYYKVNPDKLNERNEKQKIHWCSEEGKIVLAKRSEHMKKFYASEKGRLVIQDMAKKIRVKNRLSKDKFEDKLNKISETFEVLTSLPSYEDYVNHESFKCDVSVRCFKEQHVQTRKLVNVINIPHCLVCNGTFSKPQQEIADFIRSLGFDLIVNDRSIISPLELDIFIPAVNLAVEFNGVYWHNEQNRSNDYHASFKYDLTRAKNINLLTIFEDEWRDKREIVKSILKAKLMRLPNRIYARDCDVVNLTLQERKTFLEKNHVDGDVKSKFAFGLKYKLTNELVAVMSCRKPFHKSYVNIIEIARFATSLDVSVVGGLSRLLKRCASEAKKLCFNKLITYVDLRLGDGHGYSKVGLNFVRNTSVRFWWFDKGNRYDRFISEKSGLSDDEFSKRSGMCRVFGCRNALYEMNL